MKKILFLLVCLVGVPALVQAVVPAVSIVSNKGTTICSGDTVTFTATPVNGGTTPAYQWMVNGNNAGANSSTFTTTALANGDVVSCMLTSNDPLANPATANSNNINMTVNPRLTPVVAITISPNDTICAGTNVTFNATFANGGSTPTFQWTLNGGNVGANSSSYSNNALANGDVVACIFTTSEACYTVQKDTSNGIAMTVNPLLTPVINITVAPDDTICANTSTTFTATTANAGTSPVYEWRRNGVIVGSSSNSYNTTTLANGDAVFAILTSSEACVTQQKDTSSTITMTVKPNLTPTVSITANPGNVICDGTNVTFTASITNGGTSPSYQWKVNGVNTGTNSNTYSTSLLSNGQTVTCVLTSSEQCVTSATATSNPITMTVNPILAPDVTIAVNPNDTICAGTVTTFTATPVNGGATPTYQWQLNGINAGANTNSYTSSTLSSGDVLRVIMTTSYVCPTTSMDTSNSISMTVIPNVTPVVVITHSPPDTVCEGTGVTFSATSANGGSSPVFQWQVNGSNVGANSTFYATSSLNNGDLVQCVMTSNIVCVTKTKDTSNVITATVKTKKTPDVTIAANPGDTACAGSNVTFTATATGVTSVAYEWRVNGSVVGANSNTYSSSTLANGDVVRCYISTGDTCVTKTKDTSNAITMTIKPILTPDVTIVVSPDDTVCAGDPVTYTASPVNGGTSPAYQWRLNGINSGLNSATFNLSSVTNGDVIDCILTTSEQCVSKTKDTSNAIAMTVKVKVTPDAQIIVLPNDTICDGTNVTFIATPTNGGTTPAYQWQVNGSDVGTNNTSYSSNALADGDAVRVILTSSEMCVTKQKDTSNTITMKVNPNLTPDVTITVSPDDTICTGTNVTFTATPGNGGTTPAYQWRVNGSNVGTNSNTYSTTALANGDIVDCILTTSEVCYTKLRDTSNTITMTVKPYVTPDVTITVSPNDTICVGTNVTFTATPVNGGNTPAYQWQINGSNAGTNSSTFSSATLANGDVVSVILTSSEMCVTKQKDTSNNINMTVISYVTPDITISVSPDDTVCSGTLVSFLANDVNGGTTPAYQWKVNGNNVGINANGYTSNSFVNGDVVTCILTSSEMCLTKTADTSNAVTMTVNGLTIPGITILSNTGSTSCAGGDVTFSTVVTGGGFTQAYQWRLNGADISGANSTTYTTNALANGDVVTCKLNITATCPDPDSAISPGVTMNIVTPSATIAVSPNDTICDNESAIFDVTGTDVGTNPVYQWKLNGVDQVGVTGDIFTMNTVGHQDVISIDFVSSDNCINGPVVAGSNTITMTVNPTTAPSVAIVAHPGTVLNSSQIVWFTVTSNTPNITYQWRRNGVNIPGANGMVFTDLDPTDGDSISLYVTTTDSCRIPDTAVSNVIGLQVGVGVPEVKDLFSEVNIVPNPNNGTFVIKGMLANRSDISEVQVEVVNAVGVVIYKDKAAVRNNELNTRIELGDRANNGLHMVRISADGNTQVLRFVTTR